jgi:serine/threonine protein phosphatase PrpC
MQRTVTQIPGWHVETWEQPSGADASQDAHLVWRDPATPRLRVAVLDGVTPTRRCRSVAGVAGPMYAAAVTRIALQRSGRGLVESLRAANHHLHDRSITRSRDQAQTCVTAADVFDDGRIELVRAGDCEAWARRPSVESVWDRWQDANRTCGRDERHDAEERYLGRPAAWTSTALGRFPQPVIKKFTFRDAHELVLASDGARLREDVLDELTAWLAGLRRWERRSAATRRAAEKVHDDVTVIRMISGRG